LRLFIASAYRVTREVKRVGEAAVAGGAPRRLRSIQTKESVTSHHAIRARSAARGVVHSVGAAHSGANEEKAALRRLSEGDNSA